MVLTLRNYRYGMKIQEDIMNVALIRRLKDDEQKQIKLQNQLLILSNKAKEREAKKQAKKEEKKEEITAEYQDLLNIDGMDERYISFVKNNIIITKAYNDKIKTNELYKLYYCNRKEASEIKKKTFFSLTNDCFGIPSKTNGFNYYRGIQIKET